MDILHQYNYIQSGYGSAINVHPLDFTFFLIYIVL